MAPTFFRKLLTYISSSDDDDDDSDVEINVDVDEQPSSHHDNCQRYDSVDDSFINLETGNVIENEVRELNQPTGSKAKKRKRKAQGMQGEEIIQLRKMEYTLLKGSHAQKKEFYRLKVEKMKDDMETEGKKLHLENEKLRMEAEKLELAKKESDQRIMMMDLSVMPKLQRQHYEEVQREIMRRHNHA